VDSDNEQLKREIGCVGLKATATFYNYFPSLAIGRLTRTNTVTHKMQFICPDDLIELQYFPGKKKHRTLFAKNVVKLIFFSKTSVYFKNVIMKIFQ